MIKSSYQDLEFLKSEQLYELLLNEGPNLVLDLRGRPQSL